MVILPLRHRRPEPGRLLGLSLKLRFQESMYIPRVSNNDGILSISGKPLLRARCSILGYFKAMDSRGVALSSELPMFDFIPLECKCIC